MEKARINLFGNNDLHTIDNIKPSDIIPYEQLSQQSRRNARNRLLKVFNSITTLQIYTSILPQNTVLKIWDAAKAFDYPNHKLAVNKAYDGGTNFKLVSK